MRHGAIGLAKDTLFSAGEQSSGAWLWGQKLPQSLGKPVTGEGTAHMPQPVRGAPSVLDIQNDRGLPATLTLLQTETV
jgi:hypothetical protein